MAQFHVDDDLAALVERLAQRRPFENLSFNDALRRVLQERISITPNRKHGRNTLLADPPPFQKKAPSPSAADWVATVPELKGKKGLTNWKAICDVLGIDVAGDSARRRLRNWVRSNRPTWPAVPEI